MSKSNSKRVRQSSIKDSSSSEKDTLKGNVDFKMETEKHRKNKEMDNFISIFDKTLKMSKDDDKSEKDEEVREVKSHRRLSQLTKPADTDMNWSASLPYVEKSSNPDRLTARIQILHMDCIRGVGFEVLHKAFEILSNVEDDELEPQLVDLMGKDKFEQYASKIWQLKFCYESFEKNKKKNNFISPYDRTFKINKDDDKSDEDEEVKEVKSHRRVSQPTKQSDAELKMLKSNSKRVRQPSIKNSSSSEEETLKKNEDFKKREKHRKNKEMNNFISRLGTTTLKMNIEDDDKSEEDEEVKEVKSHRRISRLTKLADTDIHRSASLPSVEILCNADSLTTRIQILHTECVRGVGFEVLHKAFEILSNIEDDDLEPQLLDLMGKDKFDQYAAKIWQLKFCVSSNFHT